MPEQAKPSVFEMTSMTVEHLRASLPQQLSRPLVGIVCGSGLGGLADKIHPEPKYEVAYSSVPHFPKLTVGSSVCNAWPVQGHVGKLVFGMLGSNQTTVVLMQGRAHFYEGHTIQDVTFPIRVLKLLGIQIIIVTNAAGGLNTDFAVGDIVVLQDHINLPGLVGFNPLRGRNDDEFGLRFPPLSDAYDLELRKLAHHAWMALTGRSSTRRLHEGIYAFVGGPSYETRAECRMLRSLGADVVGMSTVPEIIVARHCQLRVLALSLVTNNAVLDAGPRGDDVQVEGSSGMELNSIIIKGKATHEEVLKASREAAKDMQELVYQFIDDFFGREN